VDCLRNGCVPSLRWAAAFAGCLSCFVSLAVCAGLIGAVSFLRQPSANSDRSSSVVTSVATEPSAEPQPANKAGAAEVFFRTFEPQGAARFGAASANSKLDGADAPLPRPSTWQTVITFESDRGWSTRSIKPGVEDRRELARALQQEHRRVGCYVGSADGKWNLQSKQAMRAFLYSVNAVLPINEPDQTLLALIKGQVGAVCGEICPEGQTFVENGRCQPKAAVVEGSIDNNAAEGSAIQPGEFAINGMRTEPGAPSSPLPGAMMIGGQRSEPGRISNAAHERTPPIENLFIHPLGGY
jgi:hypothetical protein